jgi:hypothetical protein
LGLLTDQLLKRGIHKSVAALEKDVRDWIANWNEDPKPFAWTKTAEEILDSLHKYIARISGAGHCAPELRTEVTRKGGQVRVSMVA